MQPDILPETAWQRKIYRASRLDEFRMYQSGETFMEEDYTPAEFIQRMTVEQTSPKREAGTAVHKLIEESQFGELPMIAAVNGWDITFDLDAELLLPMAREVALSRQHQGIPLFGRVDAMSATTVHDIKTTSAIDVERYLESYQWRAYLWMSGRENFIYDLFRVIVDENERSVTVKDYVAIPLARYPELDRDVESLLVEFDRAVKSLDIPTIMMKRAA